MNATNITTNEKEYIPTQMVFLYPEAIDEKPIRKEQISTGGAFGKVGEKRAFKSRLLESIERDGIMNFYLNKQLYHQLVSSPKYIIFPLKLISLLLFDLLGS